MENKAKNTQKQTSTDSFFGMALAQAFMGFAFGDVAEQIWDAGETLSVIHEDRFTARKASPHTMPGAFVLGREKSITHAFSALAANEQPFFQKAKAAAPHTPRPLSMDFPRAFAA